MEGLTLGPTQTSLHLIWRVEQCVLSTEVDYMQSGRNACFRRKLTTCNLAASASLLQVLIRADNSKALNLDRCHFNTIKCSGSSIILINFVMILSHAKRERRYFLPRK